MMSYPFAKRMQTLKPSAIREIFKYSADPSYIPLSAGNPAPNAFPEEAIREISASLLASAPISALQYSITEGYAPLREHLSRYLLETQNIGRAHDGILITSGSQQVMDLLTKAMIDPGDIILCESPSFIGSLNAFRSYEAKLIGIDMEADGINLAMLEQVLRTEKKVKYLYSIPNFQNPSGITLSEEKRKKLYAICKAYSVLILEDNPYGDLRYRGEDIPPIKALDEDGIVMYAGSFSKVVAPGMRVGYAVGPQEILQKMVVCKQGEDVHTNALAQMICHQFMVAYDYEAHLQKLRDIYSEKAKILEDALRLYFTPKGITWNPFDGGFFAWCTLPEGVDMPDFCQKALEKKVCIVPGSAFLADEHAACSAFRVNFSTPTDEQLVEGIRRLSEII